MGDNVDPVVQNRYNEKLDKKRTRVTRHLILVRHGQYNMDGRTDAERYLTEKGRKQAACSGERLKQLGFDFDKIIRSTMTRAQETAKIISGSLPELKLHDDAMLEEGAPIPPEPPVGHWRPEVSVCIGDKCERFFKHSSITNYTRLKTIFEQTCNLKKIVSFIICSSWNILVEFVQI